MKPDFTLVPIGGLGNRIYAICSAINYCIDNKKKLKVIWFLDRGLNCSFSDLFKDEVLPNDVVQIKEASYLDYIINDRPRLKNFYIPFFFQKIRYDRIVYEKEMYSRTNNDLFIQSLEGFSHIYLVDCAKFYHIRNCGKYFQLKDKLEKQVRENTVNFNSSNVIGVHIRRSDHINSINNSPLSVFIEKMEHEINRNKNVCFYLATDSEEEKNILKDRFKTRILTTEVSFNRSTIKGITDAILEMYTLSKTTKIIGSYNSTFSQIAADLSGIPLEVVMKK